MAKTGYLTPKKRQTDYLDEAFDHLQSKKQKKKYGTKKPKKKK